MSSNKCKRVLAGLLSLVNSPIHSLAVEAAVAPALPNDVFLVARVSQLHQIRGMRSRGGGKTVWEWEVVGGIGTGTGGEATETGGMEKAEKIRMSSSMDP